MQCCTPTATPPKSGQSPVRAWPTDEALAVVVSVQGSGMRPRVDSASAGLGLSSIGHLSDHVRTQDLHDGGLQVAMCFRLHRGPRSEWLDVRRPGPSRALARCSPTPPSALVRSRLRRPLATADLCGSSSTDASLRGPR